MVFAHNAAQGALCSCSNPSYTRVFIIFPRLTTKFSANFLLTRKILVFPVLCLVIHQFTAYLDPCRNLVTRKKGSSKGF